MSLYVDPISSPQTWDVVTIAGVTCPFVCKLSGWKRAHEWDQKKGKGAFGATITFVQRPPAKGSITFYATQSSHFTAWNTFLPLLKYDPTKRTVKPVDIFHPSLADIDITSVVTENIGAWENQGLKLYTRTVDFIEYFPPPPRPAVSTPSGSVSNAGGSSTSPGKQPDPVGDAQQAQIAQLWSQAQKP